MRRNAVLVLVRRVGEGERGLRWPPLKQLLPKVPLLVTAGKNKP